MTNVGRAFAKFEAQGGRLDTTGTAQTAGHPELRELLQRITRQEGRHAGYYASRARELLEQSSRARQVTRWFLRHRWDQRVDALPGLHGLGLVRSAIERRGVHRAPTVWHPAGV